MAKKKEIFITGFSIINILIIIGLFAIGLIFYTQYYNKKDLANQSEIIKAPEEEQEMKDNIISQPDIPAAKTNSNNSKPLVEEVSQTETENKTEKIEPEKETQAPNTPGYYQNSLYFYEISFPTDWPLKIRSEENISVGTVPPKNGQGAITIEVTQGGSSDEINQAKAEVKKYPGILSLKEEQVALAGVSGTKIIFSNLMLNIVNVYYILEKYGFSYAIKYSEESSEFVKQVEEVLTTFKFTK
ncbi:MAG: hypothetical protein ABIG60_03675 [Patescibacteria group bacterium]